MTSVFLFKQEPTGEQNHKLDLNTLSMGSLRQTLRQEFEREVVSLVANTRKPGQVTGELRQGRECSINEQVVTGPF
jgi:hypothetical protein